MHESTRVTLREASELSAPRPGRFGSVIAMAFDVATPVFDGPFDLLLQLILAEEVDIYEVSLATIVDALPRTRSSGCRRSTSTSPPSSC